MRNCINLRSGIVWDCLLRKFILRLILCMMLVVPFACVSTFPMHNPIYPASGESITYTVEAKSKGGIKKVRLYELVSSVNSAGTVITGTETFLKEWNPSGSPNSTTLSYTKTSGYSANRLVRYRFVVTNGVGRTRSHHVTFAIRPYPVTDQSAPIFIQGDVDHVFDVVFIPDADITNMATFRGHCKGMIEDAVLAEPSVKPWSHQFNFYINPDTGVATDYNRISTDGLHQVPANWANLSFAEVKVLMHQNNLRDYASGGLFSTEQQNRGTMMHEGGHGMFGLADEYCGGVQWQASVFPNTWNTLAAAQADAPSRHKTAGDARAICPTSSSTSYKICDDNCQMNNSGLNPTNYDEPCGDRVVYTIIDNATSP